MPGVRSGPPWQCEVFGGWAQSFERHLLPGPYCHMVPVVKRGFRAPSP